VTVVKDEVGFDLNNLELAGRLAANDVDGETLTGSSSASIGGSDSSDSSEITNTSDESDTDSSVSVTSGDNEPDGELSTCGQDEEISKDGDTNRNDSVGGDVRLRNDAEGDELRNDVLGQFVSLSVNENSGQQADDDSVLSHQLGNASYDSPIRSS